MLVEARRRAGGGKRVVVGWLQPHERPETTAQLSNLEVVAPLVATYRGQEFPELDTAGVLSSQPDVAVVDELAHSWPDGDRKRWMDVADLLAAGVDTLTSLNVANLVSARDYVARITGAGAVESVPDDFVRNGEVVLVDLPGDTLRSRLASGTVFSAEQVGGALSEYFRISNLEALAELGRAWMAGPVERIGEDLLARRGIAPLNPRDMVMAGVSGSAWGEAVILRAADLACGADADLLVVHARIADATAPRNPDLLDYYRQLTESLGGSFMQIDSESPARALAEQASARRASTVVVARHRSALSEVARGSVARRLRRLRPDLQVEEVRERTPYIPVANK
jgi:two-component system sensor histidine kinase KdpD